MVALSSVISPSITHLVYCSMYYWYVWNVSYVAFFKHITVFPNRGDILNPTESSPPLCKVDIKQAAGHNKRNNLSRHLPHAVPTYVVG